MLPPRNEDEPRRGPRICTIGRTPYMCHIRQSSLLHPLCSFVCPLQKHGLDGPKSTDCGREGGGMRERGLVSPFPRRRFPASAITPFTASRRPLCTKSRFSLSPPPSSSPIARRPGRQTAKAIAICCRNGEGGGRRKGVVRECGKESCLDYTADV